MSDSKPEYKAGAPTGNINRLSHGFYSKRFRQVEIKDLAEILGVDPLDEVSLLRVINRRIFDIFDSWSKTTDLGDIEKMLPIIDLIGKTSLRISHLLKALQIAGENEQETTYKLILQVIDDINKEWSSENCLEEPNNILLNLSPPKPSPEPSEN